MRKFILALLIACFSSLLFAAPVQREKKIAIVSVNDIHGELDRFARLSFVVDSVRALYDYTLVLSAGDNRSGNAWNDKYPLSSLPVLSMMNQIGFDASALGNHEFDATQAGFCAIAKRASFPYLCANISAEEGHELPIDAHKIIDLGGFKIGIISAIKINNGRIDSHPNNLKNLIFHSEEESIRKEIDAIGQECDMVILLSHLGYEEDIKMADIEGIDMIIGGHSHTLIDGDKRVNNIPITQAGNMLKAATISVLSIKENKLETIDCTTISLKKGETNPLITHMIDYFKANNTAMQQVIGQNITALTSTNELGVLMCDALKEYTGCDIALQNGGGVRIDALKEGDIITADILTLDPFGNKAVTVVVSGKELKVLLAEQYRNDYMLAASTAGITYNIKANEQGEVVKIEAFLPNGKKICDKKKYTLATNNYVYSTSQTLSGKEAMSSDITTAEIIIDYITRKGEIDYRGESSYKIEK